MAAQAIFSGLGAGAWPSPPYAGPMEEGTATTPVPTALGPRAVELLQPPDPRQHGQPARQRAALSRSSSRRCSPTPASSVSCSPPSPERPNLVARLRGTGDGPTLTILGHIDTVRADPEEWSRDPWSGELVDGWIWGRGALDMKGQVASEVAACLELGRSGWRPAGELLLVLTADEEAGGGLGAQWLCEQHPDRVRSDFVVNEGGGSRIELGDRRLYTLSVGEKGIFRIRLKTTGRAGHASLPRIGENALLKLSGHLAALTEQPPPEPTAVGEALLEALLGKPVRRLRGDQSRSRTPTRRGAAARRLPGRADARRHPQSDEGPGRQEGQRDPLRGRGPDRLPRPARVR